MKFHDFRFVCSHVSDSEGECPAINLCDEMRGYNPECKCEDVLQAKILLLCEDLGKSYRLPCKIGDIVYSISYRTDDFSGLDYPVIVSHEFNISMIDKVRSGEYFLEMESAQNRLNEIIRYNNVVNNGLNIKYGQILFQVYFDKGEKIIRRIKYCSHTCCDGNAIINGVSHKHGTKFAINMTEIGKTLFFTKEDAEISIYKKGDYSV